MTLGKLIYALVKVKDDNDGNDEKQREEESADKFADDVINRSALQEEKPDEEEETPDGPDEEKDEKETRKGKAEKPSGMLFSRRLVEQAAINKVADHYRTSGDPESKMPDTVIVHQVGAETETGYRVDDCMKRLDLIKTFM